MNGLRFVTLLYRFFFFFGLFACMCTGVCVCVCALMGCLKTSAGVPHISQDYIPSINSEPTLCPSEGHTLYDLPIVKCLLQATENSLLINGLFRLDFNLQHTMFVCLFDIYMIICFMYAYIMV